VVVVPFHLVFFDHGLRLRLRLGATDGSTALLRTGLWTAVLMLLLVLVLLLLLLLLLLLVLRLLLSDGGGDTAGSRGAAVAMDADLSSFLRLVPRLVLAPVAHLLISWERLHLLQRIPIQGKPSVVLWLGVLWTYSVNCWGDCVGFRLLLPCSHGQPFAFTV